MFLRLSRWLALGLCAVLALAQAALLLADRYVQYSAEILSENRDAKIAAQAAANGIVLASYLPAAYKASALALAADGRVEASLSQFRQALHLAPADAGLWAEYAETLARSGKFGPRLSAAQGTALNLGAESVSVNWQIALLGAIYWNRGDISEQEDWARATTKVLRDRPSAFQYTLVSLGRADAMCGYAGAELGLSRWCEYVRFLSEQCGRAELPSAGRQVCLEAGFREIE